MIEYRDANIKRIKFVFRTWAAIFQLYGAYYKYKSIVDNDSKYSKRGKLQEAGFDIFKAVCDMVTYAPAAKLYEFGERLNLGNKID